MVNPVQTDVLDPRLWQTQPKPRPWSRAANWLIAAVAIGLLALCLLAWRAFQPRLNEDPAAVAALQASLLEIDVPAVFTPRGTIEWNLAFAMSIRGAYYDYSPTGFVADQPVAAAAGGELMLVEVRHGYRDKPDVVAHIERVLRERGGGPADLVRDTVESRSVFIGEQLVDFQFETWSAPRGKLDPLRSFRIVRGVVEGRSGPVLIALRVPLDDRWNDDIAVALLESIR
jgi:hypothetical protein